MWSRTVFLIILTYLPRALPSYYDQYYEAEQADTASDCRQEFLSSQSKNGTFKSPHYPNPYPDINRCHYIFQGQGKERIQIKFEVLDLDFNSNTNPDVNCDDEDSVLVSIKIDGAAREIGHYCGNQQPEILMSNTNQLEVQFITRNRDNQPIQAKGFLATYKFVTDFGIHTGDQDHEQVCGFTFRSVDNMNGTFTSPNFPGHYPRGTECVYTFYGANEKVRIQFPIFNVDGISPNCDEDTKSDFVEFSNFYIRDRKMQRMCGVRYDKPEVMSEDRFFRVIFKSNTEYDATGFKAVYTFIKNKEPTTPAPLQITVASSAAYTHQHQLYTSILLYTTVSLIIIVS